MQEAIQSITKFRPRVIRIFAMITGVATLVVYGLVGIVAWQYQRQYQLFQEDWILVMFMVLAMLLILCMWFIIFGVYTRIIFPTYQTLVIIQSVLDSEAKHREHSDNLALLQDCIQTTLSHLGESRLTYRAIFQNTEKYIQQLDELSQQNAQLETSQTALADTIEELNRKQGQLLLEKVKTDAIINAIPNAIIASSRDGNIFLLNKQAEEMLGVDAEHALGKFLDSVYPFNTFVDTEDGEKIPTHEALQGITYVREFEYRVPSSKQMRSIQNIASPIILEDEIIGAIDLFRDTTKEKEVDRAQKEFVSLASHQLRTPITSIHWNAEILDADERIEPELREHVQEILEQNARMQRLVNALLNLSRIDLGTIKFVVSEIELSSFVSGLIKSLESEIQSKKLTIQQNVDKSLITRNDPVYLDVILTNIISNAIKYSYPGGEVVINAYAVREEEAIHIEVIDYGMGIPKNQQSQIFARLFRAKNAKEKETDGNGLGLYVVQKLIDAMDGSVWFNSEEDQGTTFFIKIPMKSVY